MKLSTYTFGRGPGLVLLHGWGMSGAVMMPFAESLRRDWRITIVDLPGHGDSGFAMGSGLDDWARAVTEHVPRGATWLGWSLGGLVALRAAALGARIAGLLMVSTTPCFLRRADWPWALDASRVEAMARGLRRDPSAEMRAFFALLAAGGSKDRGAVRRVRRELLPPVSHGPALRHALGILAEADLRSALAGLRCPIHWLSGDDDPLVPAEAVRAASWACRGGKPSIVPGAGHFPFLTHSEALSLVLGRMRRGDSSMDE